MDMKMFVILSVVIGVLFLPFVAAPSQTDCSRIQSPGAYIVTQNVGTGGYCINITTSHVLLDCQGFNITYGGHSVGNGVDFQGGIGNVTIKNCKFFQNVSLVGADGNKGVALGISGGGTAANITIYNNTFYTQTDLNTIWIRGVNNTNISWNSFQHKCGVFSQNTSVIDIQDMYDGHIDNNVINNTCQGESAQLISYVLSSYKEHNLTLRNNIMNASANSLTAISLTGLTSGLSVVEGNTLKMAGNGSTGMSLSGISNMQFRSNSIYVTHRDASLGVGISYGPGTFSVNNSLFDNNTISSSGNLALLPFGASNGALVIGTNVLNNVFVNNNLSSPQGILEIFEASTDSLPNYLIYNNSFGEIAWMNNGTQGFLNNLTLAVNGSLSLGETIIINSNIAAVNISAFTPVQRINSSANVTLLGLSGDTISSIVRDGINCLTSSPVSCYQISFSGGSLRFNITGWGSGSLDGFTVTTSSSNSSVPEFEDYAMMFILVIGISGFFVMKKKQEESL